MKEKHESMTKKYMKKQTMWLGTAHVSNKIRFFLPEEKRVEEAI